MRVVFFQNNIEYLVTVDNEHKTIELGKIIRDEIGKVIRPGQNITGYQTIIKIPIKESITIWNNKTSEYWLPKLKKLIVFS
jgi:hypothetical protein